MAYRRNWSLCCYSPEYIARFLRVFPKLAILFLIVHVAGLIYTVAFAEPPRKTKTETPSGTVQDHVRVSGYNVSGNSKNQTVTKLLQIQPIRQSKLIEKMNQARNANLKHGG